MIMIALLAWGFLSALVAFLPKDGSSCFAITCITCYSMKSSLLHSCALGHCWVDGPMSTFFFQKSYSGHKHPWAQVISMECHLQPQRRLYREHFDMVLYTSMLNANLYCSAHVWPFIQASVANLPTNIQIKGLCHSENFSGSFTDQLYKHQLYVKHSWTGD